MKVLNSQKRYIAKPQVRKPAPKERLVVSPAAVILLYEMAEAETKKQRHWRV